MIISPELAREIELKKQEIERNPSAYNKRAALVKDSLRAMGDVYSFWIENPELREQCLLARKKPETLKKMAYKGIQAIHNGWYYLNNKGKFGEFVQELDPTILKSTNALINGFDHSLGNFRKNEVTLNMKDYEPPIYEEVPEKVNDSLNRIKRLNEESPLLAAIYTHLSLALIQPFDSANKRTARLVQDRILLDAQLPPAIIPAGEARFYLDLLCKTAQSYANGNMQGQKQFYDYIASKVNNGLDEILGDLDTKSRRFKN